MKNLQDFLQDWVEPEYAMGFLGCTLGILKYEGEIATYLKTNKINILFTNNEILTFLFETLEKMVRIGYLEKNDDYLYRYNNNFEKN